jgi:uncharacterized membrane protein
MINDKMDKGLSEAEAIASLGDVTNITNTMKAEIMMERSERQKGNSFKDFWIILGICASPILIPIGIGLFISFLAIAFSIFVVFFSFAASSVFIFITTFISLFEMIGAGDPVSSMLIISGVLLVVGSIMAMVSIFVYRLGSKVLKIINGWFSKLIQKKSKKEERKYA